MYAKVEKQKENKCKAVANTLSHKQSGSTFQFVDNRSEAIAQRKLQEMAINSSRIKQLRREPEPGENPSSRERRFIDLYLDGLTYAKYANKQYDINKNRAKRVIIKILESLAPKQKSKESGGGIVFANPNPDAWDVTPEIAKANEVK